MIKVTRTKGFTFIEILIVMVIIGIVASFALLATGDFGKERRIRNDIEEIHALFNLAQTRAILTGKTLGIVITPQAFSFYEYFPETSRWEKKDNDKLLKLHTYADDFTFEVIEPTTTSDANMQPTVVLLQSGELSTLNLLFKYQNKSLLKLITENDQFKLRPVDDKQ